MAPATGIENVQPRQFDVVTSGGNRAMKQRRREVLAAGGGAGLFALMAAAGLIKPGESFAQSAWSKAAFEAKTVPDALAALGVAGAPARGDISITAPDIAENGAVVPVSVTSKLAKTESIAILVEKNPNALAAVFEILPGTQPSVSTRLKMGETSKLYALVRADGKYFVVVREVTVTLGGCFG
jgi:sulfur-oxidizing protein SoxY